MARLYVWNSGQGLPGRRGLAHHDFDRRGSSAPRRTPAAALALVNSTRLDTRAPVLSVTGEARDVGVAHLHRDRGREHLRSPITARAAGRRAFIAVRVGHARHNDCVRELAAERNDPGTMPGT